MLYSLGHRGHLLGDVFVYSAQLLNECAASRHFFAVWHGDTCLVSPSCPTTPKHVIHVYNPHISHWKPYPQTCLPDKTILTWYGQEKKTSEFLDAWLASCHHSSPAPSLLRAYSEHHSLYVFLKKKINSIYLSRLDPNLSRPLRDSRGRSSVSCRFRILSDLYMFSQTLLYVTITNVYKLGEYATLDSPATKKNLSQLLPQKCHCPVGPPSIPFIAPRLIVPNRSLPDRKSPAMKLFCLLLVSFFAAVSSTPSTCWISISFLTPCIASVRAWLG